MRSDVLRKSGFALIVDEQNMSNDRNMYEDSSKIWQIRFTSHGTAFIYYQNQYADEVAFVDEWQSIWVEGAGSDSILHIQINGIAKPVVIRKKKKPSEIFISTNLRYSKKDDTLPPRPARTETNNPRQDKRDLLLDCFSLQWAKSLNPTGLSDSVQKKISRVIAILLEDNWNLWQSEKKKALILSQQPRFVLNELLKNAFDAYIRSDAEEGLIHLIMRRKNGEFIIEVMDDGIGIAQFGSDGITSNPRVPTSNILQVEGRDSIGFLVSQLLIEAHGGRMMFLPEESIYRTLFRIVLPKDAVKFKMKENVEGA